MSKWITCKSQQILQGEPRNANSLDKGQMRIVYLVALEIPVSHRRQSIDGHACCGQDNKWNRDDADYLKDFNFVLSLQSFLHIFTKY